MNWEIQLILMLVEPLILWGLLGPVGTKIYCQTLDGNIERAKLLNEGVKKEYKMPNCLENLVVRYEEMFQLKKTGKCVQYNLRKPENSEIFTVIECNADGYIIDPNIDDDQRVQIDPMNLV